MEPVDHYYEGHNVVVSKAMITVREVTAPIPLLNATWKGGPAVELPAELGELQVKAVREVYQREVIEESAPEEERVFALDETGNVVKEHNSKGRDSDIDSICTSEPLIEIAKEPTPLPVSPPLDHLRAGLSGKHWNALTLLFQEFQDVFRKDRTDVGRVSCDQHDIELIKGAEPLSRDLPPPPCR